MSIQLYLGLAEKSNWI